MILVEFYSVLKGVAGCVGEVEMYRLVYFCDDDALMLAVKEYCDNVGLEFVGDGAVNNNYYQHEVYYRVSEKVCFTLSGSVKKSCKDWLSLRVVG